MHSIGSAHAEVRSRRRETSLASTTDRILLIIGSVGRDSFYGLITEQYQ